MMSLLEMVRQQAKKAPEAPFATHICAGTTLTYGAFADLADRLRAYLHERGTLPGDRIALVSTNHWVFHPLLAACAEEGRILVPVNPELHPDELRFILEDATPTLIVDDEPRAYGKRFDRMERTTTEELLQEAASLDPAGTATLTSDTDVVLFVYTSGTTGSGKAVMLTQKNLVSMAKLLADFYDVRSDDRFLCVLPLHHMNGIMITGILPLVAGAQTVLADLFGFTNAKFYWEAVSKFGITIPSLVPSIMAILLRLFPNGPREDLTNVRYAFCGTAPLADDLWQAFEKRFGMSVYQGYGLTEGTTWATCTPFDPNHRHDTVGVPLGTEIVVDGQVTNVSGQKEGQILFKGPMVMKGYYRKARLTKEIFRGEFLKTGDIGYFDEDGELHITGRKKEITIRNGININPVEIDDVIRRHQAVAECKTIGLDDKITGEAIATVCVAVDPTKSPDGTTIKDWVRDNMSAFYVPDQVTFMGYLPKGPTGKVTVKTLKKILTGELAEEALKKLTAWKYKRSKPSDAERIIEILQSAYLKGAPVRFLTYWGCGKRDSIMDIDKTTIDRLAEYLRDADLVEQARPTLTMMLNDMHSTINGIPRAQFETYYAEIAEYAHSAGFLTVFQSAAWRNAKLDVGAVIEEARSRAFDERWAAFPDREKLLVQAGKHFRGDCNESGARSYALACLTERGTFAKQFPEHIFLTYNGPSMNACLPDLPTLYLYSYKKGKTEKPWFL
ncbi:MAG: class I adenylate-forming enzyme family protein [bacterium]|nr:class I adenylate-forming enzyme family protein [bacterium]